MERRKNFFFIEKAIVGSLKPGIFGRFGIRNAFEVVIWRLRGGDMPFFEVLEGYEGINGWSIFRWI